MTLVSDLRRQVEQRIKELEPAVAEYEQLKRIAATFDSAEDGAPASRARRRARPAAAAPRARSRKKAVDRPGEVLKLVKRRPGVTVPEAASAMGIGPTYLYRVLPRLEREGKVRKEGKGYHPA
jgi:hypothetical protein